MFHFKTRQQQPVPGAAEEASLPGKAGLDEVFKEAVVEATRRVQELLADGGTGSMTRVAHSSARLEDAEAGTMKVAEDLLARRDSGAMEKLKECQRIADCRLALATLDLAVSCVRSAAADLLLDRPIEALLQFAEARRNLSEHLPEDNDLMKIVSAEIDKLEALPICREALRNPLISRPELALSRGGFEATFRFPLMRDGVPANKEHELRRYLLDLTREAEKAWARQYGSAGPYNNSISDHSVCNSIAKRGPKLIDPGGVFRGRISSNTIAAESCANTIGKYGSTTSKDSIFNTTSAVRRCLFGQDWRIIADQS